MILKKYLCTRNKADRTVTSEVRERGALPLSVFVDRTVVSVWRPYRYIKFYDIYIKH